MMIHEKQKAVANPAPRMGIAGPASPINRYYGVGDMQEDVHPSDSLAGDPTTAEDLNARIQQVADMVAQIEKDAAEAGIYADRASISALRSLAEDARAIYSRWMQQQDMGNSEYKHEPSKVVEVKKEGPPEDHSEFNAFGGQVRYPDRPRGRKGS